MMKYKGYLGQATYDQDDKVFYGTILGLKAIITFEGTTVEEIEQAFKDSVDDYLEWCSERNKKPEKTYSGKLNIRIDPLLHAKLNEEAYLQNLSLNSLIVEKLRKDG